MGSCFSSSLLLLLLVVAIEFSRRVLMSPVDDVWYEFLRGEATAAEEEE